MTVACSSVQFRNSSDGPYYYRSHLARCNAVTDQTPDLPSALQQSTLSTFYFRVSVHAAAGRPRSVASIEATLGVMEIVHHTGHPCRLSQQVWSPRIRMYVTRYCRVFASTCIWILVFCHHPRLTKRAKTNETICFHLRNRSLGLKCDPHHIHHTHIVHPHPSKEVSQGCAQYVICIVCRNSRAATGIRVCFYTLSSSSCRLHCQQPQTALR